MHMLKHVSNLVFHLVLASVSMLVAYILSTMIVGQTNTSMTAEEANQAGGGLVVVSLITSLVLSYITIQSPWHGLKLIAGIATVHFGAETALAQLETAYYNNAVQMSQAEFNSVVVAGILRALVFAPLVVLIFGKMKKPRKLVLNRGPRTPAAWISVFSALAVSYLIIYFLFGYFIAWQWEEIRLYYTGTTAIKPFFAHFWDLFLKEDPVVLPFQLLRGALWTLLAFTIIRMLHVERWKGSLVVAFTFAVLLALPLGMFPNPYLPPTVAKVHFYEIASSMLLFGAIAGWVLDQGKV